MQNMPLGSFYIVSLVGINGSLDVFSALYGWLANNVGYSAAFLTGTVVATWQGPQIQVPVVTTADAADQVSAISIAGTGVSWLTAQVWSKAGEWVRRQSWPDANKMLHHDAGAGSVRAIALIKSTAEPVARVVRNSEFGPAEYGALDWTLKFPPASGAELDLTDAMLAVDAAPWVFWKVPAIAATSGTGTASPTAGGATSATAATAATPATGAATPQGFVYRRNGTDILVPAKDVSGGDWQP
jgi:hypothetical protein